MSIEEKSERAAAIKVNKLYCAIIEENKSKEEVDAIKDALDDDEAFCSQKYNECFMNIFGYPDEQIVVHIQILFVFIYFITSYNIKNQLND